MSDAPIAYRLVPSDPAGHIFTVELTIAAPDPSGQVVSLPVWIPGSYLVREFARNITRLEAHDDRGPVAIEKIDKTTWRAAPASGALVLTGEVYAWDLSVRTAHLDETHGFFNGTSVFLRVHGQDQGPHRVIIEPPQSARCTDWRVATTLPRVSGGAYDFGTFEAADYDELADHPVEMGTFDLVHFEACGVPHSVALTGRYTLDADRLRADLARICETHIRFFGEPAPMKHYLFQTMVVGKGYGGLEHRSSTALICNRADLPRAGMDKPTDGYRKFLGLASHEYFHTWNVKRIKPAAFTPYDLSRENHTTLLWAFEGITSYYDDLGLVRSGCIDALSYLELLGRVITRVWRVPGRFTQSLADSSFDAWTRFYRQDENASNALVSYYTKGSLAALTLDLELRRQSANRISLDDVMHRLWTEHGQTGVGVGERDIERIAAELLGEDLADLFDPLIRGTEDPPLAELLSTVGVRFCLRPSEGPDDKGGAVGTLDNAEERGDLGAVAGNRDAGARLTSVRLGGAAHAAGLSAGDVVVAFDGLRVKGKALVERAAEMKPGQVVSVHAFRRDELMTFEVTLQAPPKDTVHLELIDDVDEATRSRRVAWLGQ